MAFQESEKIWMNGELVDWKDAKVHVLCHGLHYGSAVFEGQRCYKTKNGPACFRLIEHTDRLFNSAKVYRMKIPYTKDEINQAILNLIAYNKLESCYVRPLVYRGYGKFGVDPTGSPIDVAIAVWYWGAYLGPEAVEKGVDVCVSSWNRAAPNTFPSMAKSGANYANSQLVKMEALANGYAEGIALDTSGHVSEGSGENVFIVLNGAIITPPLGSSILSGITRDCVITFAREMGIEVLDEEIPREQLYMADEVFFSGSAAEVTPVRSIDKIAIGNGGRGPIAKKLQDHFYQYTAGDIEDKYGWLTPVPKTATVTV
ncbi:branched-chain amino acid transaminase [Candidatus Zixiibacteriota bacterium]